MKKVEKYQKGNTEIINHFIGGRELGLSNVTISVHLKCCEHKKSMYKCFSLNHSDHERVETVINIL